MRPVGATAWPPPANLVARSPRNTLGHHVRAQWIESIPTTCSGSPARDRSSEAYGFTGSIAAAAAALAYLAWAYAPEPWLRSLGVAYYPSKSVRATPLLSYWALAAPAFVMVAVALAVTAYMGSNLLLTHPPNSFHTVSDEYARERPTPSAPGTGQEKPIEPIADIGIHHINHLMFGGR
ncbi:hypothetical protein ACP70R_020836 [Stipagrostis hirtigluma subsp. patula]